MIAIASAFERSPVKQLVFLSDFASVEGSHDLGGIGSQRGGRGEKGAERQRARHEFDHGDLLGILRSKDQGNSVSVRLWNSQDGAASLDYRIPSELDHGLTMVEKSWMDSPQYGQRVGLAPSHDWLGVQ